ncbi:MAG: hypothetical protein ACR2J8_08490 [Thermomicrobiales bacterium]
MPEQLDERAEYIALGHFHLPGEQTPNAWYSGSTERYGFRDEEVDTGYNIVTLGNLGDTGLVNHISLPARPMMTLKPVDAAGLEARNIANLVLDRAFTVKNPDAMARVFVRGAARPVRREAERFVRAELGDAVWMLEIKAPTDFTAIDAETGIGAELPPLPELFQQFIDHKLATGAYDEPFAAAFRDRGAAAISDAIVTAAEQTANEGDAQ